MQHTDFFFKYYTNSESWVLEKKKISFGHIWILQNNYLNLVLKYFPSGPREDGIWWQGKWGLTDPRASFWSATKSSNNKPYSLKKWVKFWQRNISLSPLQWSFVKYYEASMTKVHGRGLDFTLRKNEEYNIFRGGYSFFFF